MPLAPSGYIRMGGTDTDRSVNVQLGRASNATVSFTEAAVRTLTGRASGSVTLPNDFWGKPAGFTTVSLATVPSQSFAFYTTSTSINIYLIFNANGTWVVEDDSGEINSGNWGSPTTAGGGAAYYIRFTLTQATPNGTENPFAPAGWNSLSVPQYCSTNVSFFDLQTQSATWTIDIATDSSGSNIIATRSDVRIFAVPGSPP
jgi:hypothetical protein